MANPTVVVDFVANTAKLVDGIKGVGSAGEDAAKSTNKISGKALVAWGAAGVALGVATKFVKDATSATQDLAKQTLAVQRVTGMDTETSSAWVSVLKSRGIEVSTFTRSMTILSKQMVAASSGSKKSSKAFEDLGVNMADVRAGNTEKVLAQVSDGLSKMTDPAKRAALTQQLFGRSAQALTPLLYAGSGAIQDQLDMAKRYGATLSDDTVKGVKDTAGAQREMSIAMEGIKIQIGTALIPVIATLVGVLATVVRALQPILSNATVLKVALGVLATAFVAYQVATIAAAIATTVFNAAAAPVIIWAVAIVVAIAALIAIGYLLYKHWGDLAALAGQAWGAIKAGASAVLDWLKSNWPLIVGILLGPIGVAIALIVQNWSTISSTTTKVWNSIKAFLSSTVGAIASALSSAWSAIASTISSITSSIGSAVSSGWNAIRSTVVAIGEAIRGAVATAWNAISGTVATVVGAIKTAVSGLASFLAGPIGTMHSLLSALGRYFDLPLGAAREAAAGIRAAVEGIVGSIRGIIGGVSSAMSAVANAIKAPVNAVLRAWNSLSFTVPSVTIPGFPGVKVAGKEIVPGWGGTTIGGGSWRFPSVPLLARGGVFDTPTLAVVGEAGREIVAPESLLRAILSEVAPSVRVFIGETELRGIVRTEVRSSENATAAALLGGLA